MISTFLTEKIRQRAYEIWEVRQATGQFLIFEKGETREITALDDWCEAECEILKEYKKLE